MPLCSTMQSIYGMIGDYTSLCSLSETHIASKGLPQLCIPVLKIYDYPLAGQACIL